MTGNILRKRRRRNVASKLIARDHLGALERTAPRRNRSVRIEKVDGADGSHVIVETLALPHGNPLVQQCVAEGEKQFYVLIEGVGVPLRDGPGQNIPMG